MLPDKDHPIWGLLRALVAVGGMAIFAVHAWETTKVGHVDAADAEDGAGLAGLGALAWTVARALKE